MALSILVVEDEQQVRAFARKVLEKAGYTVIEACSGKEAVSLVGTVHLDLVLTDLVMPDFEGLELIRRLRESNPDLKLVAMSGAFEGQFLKIAKLLGVKATLHKPFVPGALIAAVQSACHD
ncbi:MAG: response regulator [Acidobacteriota bacterium]